MSGTKVSDVEDANWSKLAAMGVLSGCLVCACLLLVFALASGPGSVTNTIESESKGATAPTNTEEIITGPLNNKAETTSDQGRYHGTTGKAHDKRRDARPASSKYKNAYVDSVPGKAPKLTELQ
jgi:hypothetical protein